MTVRKSYLRMVMSLNIGMSFLVGASPVAAADEVARDSVEVQFRVGKSNLDRGFGDNSSRLDSLLGILKGAGPQNLTRIEIFGGASPEGPSSLNRRLSLGRARSLADYVGSNVGLPDSLVSYTTQWWDWEGLRSFVVADPDVPNKEEVTGFLDFVTSLDPASITEREQAGFLRQLVRLGGGSTYRHISRNIFPRLRRSRMVMEYLLPQSHVPVLTEDADTLATSIYGEMDEILLPGLDGPSPSLPPVQGERKPFYMALKTNLIYDALAIPDLHAEFYLGKGWSLAGGGMYAWWSHDPRHRYWRIYGGDIGVRRWFGKAASRKPLTGHHIGVYGGVVTFDFETGGEGYMGGKPGGTLLDRCLGYGGIEYGFSLPVAKRINIDFSIGAGYLGGRYIKYEPLLGIYHKTGEYRVSYFGPTKAEISLVWLLGRGNTNRAKGGER